MINQQEVKVRPGALVEGTLYRRDKGPRATEVPVEVIGTMPYRTKVKRRKAAVLGKLAPSSEVPISTGNTVVVATRMA
jgi:hypothetical protein